MKDRKGPVTAGELLDELEQDPEYVKRMRQHELDMKESSRRYSEAAKGVIGDLERVGISIETMPELRQREVGNRQATPVLLKWMPQIEYEPLKQDLIGVLDERWARPTCIVPLMQEFLSAPPVEDAREGVRWRISDVLERVADERIIDEMIDVATDASYGKDRYLIIAGLGNMRKAKERVLPILLELLDELGSDETVLAVYPVMGFAKLKTPEALPAVERFVNHPDAWVRKKAKQAAARLSNAADA